MRYFGTTVSKVLFLCKQFICERAGLYNIMTRSTLEATIQDTYPIRLFAPLDDNITWITFNFYRSFHCVLLYKRSVIIRTVLPQLKTNFPVYCNSKSMLIKLWFHYD